MLPRPQVFNPESSDDGGKLEMWRNGITEFFRKVNSTLAVRTVPVQWVDPSSVVNQDAVAFTDGETIFLNPRVFEKSIKANVRKNSLLESTGAIAEIKGASYHELAHILWTPRNHAQPTKALIEKSSITAFSNIMRAFNILEDQRIETRFVAKYRGSEPYFVAMSERFIVDDASLKTNPAMAFILSYGRRFLGNDVRELARGLYDEWHKANGLISGDSKFVANIIDEYRLLVFPRDWEKAVKLVTELSYVLHAIEGKTPTMWSQNLGGEVVDGGENGGEHAGIKRGTAVRTAEQDNDVEAVKKYDEEMEKQGAKESSESSSDSGSSDESSDSDGDADSDGNSGSGDETGSGANSGGLGQLKRKIAERRRETESVIAEDSFQDMKNISKTVMKARRQQKPDLRNAKVEDTTSIMRSSSNKIRDAFIAIRAEGEEIWESNSAHGRLNTGLAMNARRRHLNVFDQWVDAGDEALSFEIVLLIDQSGSMQGYKAEQVGSALWIIRNACRELDIPVTVIGYDDHAWLVFSSDSENNQTKYHVLHSRGGTEPSDALAWAENIFATSTATHKLLFTLTDGDWHGYNKTPINNMTKSGVHTTLVVQGNLRYGDKYSFPSSFSDSNYRKVTYSHDRVVKVGNSQREFPNLIAGAIKEIASEVVNATRM